ncbi:MAG: hypothetical protein ACI9SC_001730 [Gammaproteobacteria bacterium]|jgi:hypothetical protein
MKKLSPLIICLVLSLTLVGQAFALQNTLQIEGISKVLQMHIERKIVNSLRDDKYFLPKRFSKPMEQQEFPIDQPDVFHMPDCLCHFYTRVL